jgi:group I intron endonuclease
MGSIYVITNTINKKLYIGQTINDVNKRFKKHLSQVNCKNICSALYSAFKIYGKDNFTIQIIVSGDYTKSELNDLEKKYIKQYNSLSPNGYNLQTGGNSFLVSESVKKQTSEKLKGREILWKEKVSQGVKKLWENKEYREKQTKQRHEKRGKYKPHNKPLRLNLDVKTIKQMYSENQSINSIAKYFGCSFYTIKKRLENVN